MPWWLLRFQSLLPCLISKSFQILYDPMNCSLSDSSGHGISLDWVAITFSRGSSWLRDWTWISFIGRKILYQWVMRGSRLAVITTHQNQGKFTEDTWIFYAPSHLDLGLGERERPFCFYISIMSKVGYINLFFIKYL